MDLGCLSANMRVNNGACQSRKDFRAIAEERGVPSAGTVGLLRNKALSREAVAHVPKRTLAGAEAALKPAQSFLIEGCPSKRQRLRSGPFHVKKALPEQPIIWPQFLMLRIGRPKLV